MAHVRAGTANGRSLKKDRWCDGLLYRAQVRRERRRVCDRAGWCDEGGRRWWRGLGGGSVGMGSVGREVRGRTRPMVSLSRAGEGEGARVGHAARTGNDGGVGRRM